MPQFCAVPDCRSNSLRDQISFFRFPSEFDNSSGKINPLKKERREAWIRALGRSDLTENKIKNQRICEKHFVSGRPALLEDKADPDWQPSLNLGHREGKFDFERSLTEETKRIHITPLLDHNYASKPPPLPAIALSMDSNIPEMVENEDFSEDQEETLPEIKKEKEFIEEKDQKIIPVIKQEEPKVKIEPNEESSKNDEKPVKKVEDKKKKPPKVEKERTDSTNSQSWEEEDWVTRCICGFDHDDGYMISCDKCMVWQHVDCMELERDNIPETYHCEECSPRTVDQAFARKLQANKKRIFDKLAKIDEAEKAKALAEASSEEASDSGTDENAGRKSNGKRKKRETPNMPSKVKKKKILTKRESRSKMPPEPTVEAKIPSELRTWIDTYEEAITNHYSPELRARVSSLKNVEVHCPKRLFKAYENLDSRTIVRPSNSSAHPKMLVAGEEIPPSEPIVEIRGKYMLARGPGQPEKPEPGPSKTNPRDNLVFRHTLFGPGSLKTHVEVDTSTYGNRARFIRSSCKPNSQILHCIEKGTLHLYIVSSERIEAGSEVTLAHRPGVSCALLQNCSLLGDSRSKGRRKVLKERKKTDARQNNNYVKSYPQQRKRAGPSERTYLNKTTKSSGGEASQNLTSARLPITDQLKSTESKFLQSNSLKKP